MTMCTFLVVALNLLYHLTSPACRFTLKLIGTIVRACQDEDDISTGIPADLSTALQHFNIEPDSMTYACCPKCFALYPPRHPSHLHDVGDAYGNGDGIHGYVAEVSDPDALPFLYDPNMGIDAPAQGDDQQAQYPMYCTYRDTMGDSECGARLLRRRKRSVQTRGNRQESISTEDMSPWRPIRAYQYQPLISWIRRMLVRRDFERMIDQSLVHAVHGHSLPYVDDILQSYEVTALLDWEGHQFLRQVGNEAHLIFSLFIDWFNPRGNRKAGASISSGVLFVACLNLPAEVRYKRENIFLAGVLPGPKAPSLQEVNHYMSPLVPELLELWGNGVALTRTAMHPQGRIVRGLLIPVVADLGAVRKTTGYASHSATYFCSFCQLRKSDISQIDPSKWPRRSCEEFRRLAKAWYIARNSKERERLFKAHGVRYSVLLELPYWKPTQYVVLDTMHNLFLGLFQRHCRKVFGMNIAVDEGTAQSEDNEVTTEDLAVAINELQKQENPHSLKAHLTLPAMRALYEAASLGDPGKRNKLQMAQELLSQVFALFTVSICVVENEGLARASNRGRLTTRCPASKSTKATEKGDSSGQESSRRSTQGYGIDGLTNLNWSSARQRWSCSCRYTQCRPMAHVVHHSHANHAS